MIDFCLKFFVCCPGIDECKSRRPVCSQVCVEKKIGYDCKCYQGYTFNDTLDTELNTSQRNQIQRTSPNRKCVGK